MLDRVVKNPFVYLMLIMLSACDSLPKSEFLSADRPDYAANSALAGQLKRSDRAALDYAFVKAMNEGGAQGWTGKKASGEVNGRGYSLGNLRSNPDERIALAVPTIDLNVIVETELGDHVLTRNSNIRRGPSNQSEILEVLPSGQLVEVVGKSTTANWMLIAVDGVVRGYVFGNLLIKAPGTELELAGGPRRKPLLCREFSQRLTIKGRGSDRWLGAACNDGTGWRLVQAAPAPQRLF